MHHLHMSWLVHLHWISGLEQILRTIGTALLGYCFMYLLMHLHYIFGPDQITRTTCTAFDGTLLHVVHLHGGFVIRITKVDPTATTKG